MIKLKPQPKPMDRLEILGKELPEKAKKEPNSSDVGLAQENSEERLETLPEDQLILYKNLVTDVKNEENTKLNHFS